MQSLSIGKIRGISLWVHWSWLLFAAVLVIADSPLLIYLVALLPIVLLHELGHSLVAQHFGLRVVDITFWPLGGFARMSRIPEDSRIEGLIAIAGPAVNLALAALLAPLIFLGGSIGELTWTVVMVNLLLGVTNLLPAFPLDGGRVLRAFLGRKGDWVKATERTVGAGRVVALLMVVLGLATMKFLLCLFAVFFWIAGVKELFAVRLRHGISPINPRVFEQAFGARGFGEQADDAPDEMMDGMPFPHAQPREASSEVSPQDGGARPGDGFSAEDIERLEKFPGSMRQMKSDS